MACAGIIGASHTTDSTTGLLKSSGMISLNPNVNIIPIKKFKSFSYETYEMTAEDNAEAILDSDSVYNADILSNSWGFKIGLYYDIVENAIFEVATKGRNGLGCPVIFASGNSTKYFDVRFPASAPYAFSVGATQLDDYRFSYSCYGDELDIVAPSGPTSYQYGDVWSLDQMGFDGPNPQFREVNCEFGSINCEWFSWECPPSGNDLDYNCHFGGTSAAAPIVAGVASLILAKDPTLTAQQVYEILRNSAVKDLDWGTIPDTPHVE